MQIDQAIAGLNTSDSLYKALGATNPDAAANQSSITQLQTLRANLLQQIQTIVTTASSAQTPAAPTATTAAPTAVTSATPTTTPAQSVTTTTPAVAYPATSLAALLTPSSNGSIVGLMSQMLQFLSGVLGLR